MRHKSKSQSTGKGIAGRDAQFADNKLTDALFKAPERHLTHFSKVLYALSMVFLGCAQITDYLMLFIKCTILRGHL